MVTREQMKAALDEAFYPLDDDGKPHVAPEYAKLAMRLYEVELTQQSTTIKPDPRDVDELAQ